MTDLNPRRLPPYITEEDVAAIARMVSVDVWNAAIEAAMAVIASVDSFEEVPLGVTLGVEALRRHE